MPNLKSAVKNVTFLLRNRLIKKVFNIKIKQNKKTQGKMRTKIKLIAGIFFMLFATVAFAEKETGVSGQVKDAETKKPVEFSTVSILNTKDSLIMTAVSDEHGFFILPLKRGKYKLITQYVGYKPDTLNIFVKTGTEFIGTIKLYKDENQIDEVTITGKSENVLIDKDEYIVTTKMKTGTASTKDVLDKVKGVTYDRYNNSIKVDNEDNIVILVNGLQKDQEYILNLNPERLKKVEIIRDPSGRYALEGYSAVINIILKEDYKGLEFFTEDNFLIDTDNKHKDYLPMNHFSGSLNYTYNKINFYAKATAGLMNFSLLSSDNKQFENGLTIEKNPPDDTPNFNINRIYDRLTGGIDYYINPKHTVSFETGFSGLLFPETRQKSNFNTSYFNNGTEILNFNSEYLNNTSSKNNYNTLFYTGILNSKNTLKADFTFSSATDNYSIDYYENDSLKSRQTGTNYNNYTKFNAELNHTVNDKSAVQIGYGNTWKKVNNIYDFNENGFIRTDLRHQFFVYYSYKFSKKIGIKIGAAGETSTPEIEGKKKSYFIYQPYADIKISPIKMLDIRLKYRSESNYPSVTQANPDTILLDETTVSTGNPYLEPSVTHKLSIRFNIMHGLASFEPYYHFSNNYISKIGFSETNGNFVYSYDNIGEYKHYGFKAGLTIPFGKSLFWQNNANFFKSSILYNNEENSIKDWTMSSNLIYVNKKYGSTAGIIYQNNLKKYITAQGYNMWNNDFWGLMIQQPLLKKRLNIMIFYMMPINFGVDFQQGSYTKTDTYVETNIQDISILKNMLMFRLSFRLNKGKSIKKTDKNLKLEDEKQEKGGII